MNQLSSGLVSLSGCKTACNHPILPPQAEQEVHTLSGITFPHLHPNSAIAGYATDGTLRLSLRTAVHRLTMADLNRC